MKRQLKRALPLALIAAALAPAGAAAEVTRTAVTTPATPTYRLYERSIKSAEADVRVVGTSDGASGDLVDLVCTRGDSMERAAA